MPLDPDTPHGVRLGVAEAQSLGERALQKLGFPEDEARIVAAHLVDAALCGYGFAGLARILTIAEDPRTREPRRPVAVVHETPASALVDGGNHVGYYAVHRAAGIAIEKARGNRIAVVGVHNSYLSGRNAYYLEMIAHAGFAGIHLASGPPSVVPLGGTKAALGTNPMAFGLPAAGNPVIFDMGTASQMRGEVILRSRLGEELPEGSGIDAQGRPTRDPRAVLDGGGILPFGGHKGYGLSFSIQAMCLLAGAALTRGKVQDFAFLFVVFDPALLMPAAEFQRQLAALIAAVKSTPRRPGVAEILIPSERAFREREQRRREGIVLERKVHDAILRL
jgi:LDH2 family malate/lactate/ureidoglycolate dehydrogenase